MKNGYIFLDHPALLFSCSDIRITLLRSFQYFLCKAFANLLSLIVSETVNSRPTGTVSRKLTIKLVQTSEL